MTAHEPAVRDTPHVRIVALPPRPTTSIGTELGLVSCSSCLRVQRGSTWIEADVVIRELRSFELPDAPRLRPGLCGRCRAALAARRGARRDSLAA